MQWELIQGELFGSRRNTLQGNKRAEQRWEMSRWLPVRQWAPLLLLFSNTFEPEYKKNKFVLPCYNLGFYYKNKVSPKTAYKSNLHGWEEPCSHIQFKDWFNSKGQFSKYKFREEIQIVMKTQLYVSNCLSLSMEKYILFTCSSETRKVKEKQANTRSWALSPQALIDLGKCNESPYDLRKTKTEFKVRNAYINKNIKQFKNKRKSRNGGHTVQEQII